MIYLKAALLLKDYWKPILMVLITGVVLVLLGPFLLLTSSTPGGKEDTIKKYIEVATNLQINWVELVAFDMVKYENHLDGKDPHDSAYHFIKLKYEEYKTEEKCIKTNKETGQCEEKQTQEIVTSSKEIKGKKAVQDFFAKFNLSGNSISNNIKKISDMPGKRVISSSVTLDEAMDDAKFTKDQKEYVKKLIEAGTIQQMFPDAGTGTGAVCTPSGTLNKELIRQQMDKAGKFKGMTDDFISIAEKHKIDPVIFISIAFHETGRGTSRAVREKNNPGGIMGSGGLWTFSTLHEGLDFMAKNLYKLYISQGLTTIPKIGAKYAPVGASNDPQGMNKDWVPVTTQIANSLGGLTMNCEAGNQGGGIVLDGSGGQKFDANKVYTSMAQFLGRPYVWAGANPAQGFDCSGLMQWNFRQAAGINLPRTAQEQYNATARVSKEQLQPGDLVFFYGTYVGPKVTHVGMYIGNGKMINSNSSGIKIDNVFEGYWNRQYYGGGRIVR